MLQGPQPEVFTAAELARAAGIPRSTVDATAASGELRFIPGTRYISASDAITAAGRLRVGLRNVPTPAPAPIFSLPLRTRPRSARTRPAAVSCCVHLTLLLVAFWLTGGRSETAGIDTPQDATRLVFVVSPGSGGGGGGGGLRNPLPARKLGRQGIERPRLSVPPPPPAPQPIEPAPEPIPARTIVAPVVAAAADTREQAGVLAPPPAPATSQGPGLAGGAGSGQGSGIGEGAGAGIGDGSGGGTGGGPYRPGSGVEPPRLLREVKADYTDEARRRNLSGDVVLEIVVRRDGSVGEVTVQKGLGAGLDERAVAAVRQWRFDPARLKGSPVDVVVEVAVEFTLR